MAPLTIAQVKLTPIGLTALHQYIGMCVKSRKRVPILHVNVHGINLAQSDKRLRTILNTAPVVFCDGFGVRLGALVLGHKTPPRITYADWMHQLSPFCEQHGFSLYLLGAELGVAEQAARNLLARYPRLKIVGTQHGFFEKSGAENDAVVAQINEVRPDLLLVSLGMPLQEKWIAENIERLETHVLLSGGACLDYLAGRVRRGPPILVNHGFEWLARLLIEPRRLWRRYLLGNPYFVWLVLRQWWQQGRSKHV